MKTNYEESSNSTDGMAQGRIHWRRMPSSDGSETIVLVMGYSGSMESWHYPFLNELSRIAHVILIDNRGTGYSFHPDQMDDFRVEAMANDVKDVVEELGLTRFHLLGYSLGGCVAQAYAEKWGADLASLILMSTTAGGMHYVAPAPDLLKRLSSPEGDSVFEKSLSLWRQCLSEESIARHLSDLKAIHEAQSRKMTPLRTFAGQMRAFRSFAYSGDNLTEVTRVAVISGEDDRLMPHGNSLALQAIHQGSQLISLKECEHMPYLEKMQETVSFLADWMGSGIQNGSRE